MTLKIKEDITYLLDMADSLQKEATKENIVSVFDDGGFRELLLTRMFGLNKMAGRLGDDGVDKETGNHYELKTVNLIDTSGNLRIKPTITTCHHFNHDILKRYRAVTGFVVGIFYINEPVRIYEVHPTALEHHLSNWENRLKTEKIEHLNNPKFSFMDIVNNGTLLYQDNKYDEYFKTIKENKVIRKPIYLALDGELKKARTAELMSKKIRLT